jgi:hypothetical protein
VSGFGETATVAVWKDSLCEERYCSFLLSLRAIARCYLERGLIVWGWPNRDVKQEIIIAQGDLGLLSQCLGGRWPLEVVVEEWVLCRTTKQGLLSSNTAVRRPCPTCWGSNPIPWRSQWKQLQVVAATVFGLKVPPPDYMCWLPGRSQSLWIT